MKVVTPRRKTSVERMTDDEQRASHSHPGRASSKGRRTIPMEARRFFERELRSLSDEGRDVVVEEEELREETLAQDQRQGRR
jgi:hypothetical protein